MNRRTWLQKSGLATAGILGASSWSCTGPGRPHADGNVALRVAHITDVHLAPDHTERCKAVFRQLMELEPDLVLNGGDTIMTADHSTATREQVLAQWQAWDEATSVLDDIPVYSCIGNHDMWWAAADEQDPLYGKPFAVERSAMPSRYYTFTQGGWHFFVLDSNHSGVSLDEEQMEWLDRTLGALPAGTPVLVMSHHPIVGVSGLIYPTDHYSTFMEMILLFYKHTDKPITAVSGHMHLVEEAVYNGVVYLCNGSVSGFWWGEGNERSAGPGYYHQTPPGFALLTLYDNGRVERTYHQRTS